MFRTAHLVAALLLSNLAYAAPIAQVRDSGSDSGASLHFSMVYNVTDTTIAAIDRARAQELISKGFQSFDPPLLQFHRYQATVPATNVGVNYVANIGVGSPSTPYSLLIDTGSANTWVGASKPYTATKSSINTHRQVNQSYGSGGFTGTEYTDTLTFSSTLSVSQQSIGVANSTNGFHGIDGILGLGPTALTRGSVAGLGTIPTVMDNLQTQRKISTELLSISFNPSNRTTNDTNGSIDFGAVDASKYNGSITYVPITQTQPASSYWGINQTVTYGGMSLVRGGPVVVNGQPLFKESTAGIVDTGTTLTLFASDVFRRYRTLTGATPDAKTGLLKITNAQYQKLQSLFFAIGGTIFEMTPNAQLWPRSLNTYIGGETGGIYLIVGDLGQNSGQGLDFINGYTFLERFYSVYDTTNDRVGLATTVNTYANTN